MRIVAACSWFNESPEDLRRMIRSLRGLADRCVFVDGPYALFPAGRTRSSAKEIAVIHTECVKAGLDYVLEQREHPRSGNEVEKRAHMLALALVGTTTDDWVFQIDADVEVTDAAAVRDRLAHTDCLAATATATGVSNNGTERDGRDRTFTYRPFYRALPGLTVEGSHWRHVAGTRAVAHPQDESRARYYKRTSLADKRTHPDDDARIRALTFPPHPAPEITADVPVGWTGLAA